MYGSATRATSTGSNRAASSELNSTPRRPASSTEYSRTSVSANVPRYGNPGLAPDGGQRRDRFGFHRRASMVA
jgi:hypothetical protein